MPSFFQMTMNPAMYHGFNKKAPYFEGWYYKLVSADEAHRFSLIPGIILGEKGHAFIQVLDGVRGEAAYHIYPEEEFWASEEGFEVRIGPNRFTSSEISLDVETDSGRIQGDLRFDGVTPWPVSLLSPGIMGWYAWVPRMECYHGVLGFDHEIHGTLNINGDPIDFSGGRGYIEKDWGQSFPEAWVWFQTNHFSSPGTCLTASVAVIPWLWTAFPGFIVGLWHNGELYRFATYTGAKIETLDIGEDAIRWAVRDRKCRLEMNARKAPGGVLLGPTTVEMGKRVAETLSATVAVRLSTLSGDVLFEDEGRHAGLEAHGDLTGLINS